MIADSNLEAIQSFERRNCSKLCSDAIIAGKCDSGDIAGFFKQTVILSIPYDNTSLTVSQSRLEFKISNRKEEKEWSCVYATSGPWAAKLHAKSLTKAICDQNMNSLKLKDIATKDTEFTYIHVLARLFDLVHPSHQLQAAVLAYPLYGVQILKRRILALQYEIGGGNDENTFLDHKLTTDLVRQLQKKLEREMRAYYEFIVPYRANWRVGLGSSSRTSQYRNFGYAGKDSYSFGFSNKGCIIINDVEYRYIENLSDSATENHLKVIGIITDLYQGSIQLVVDGVTYPPAFGRGSSFPIEEQERQRSLITKQQILPIFSLLDGDSSIPQETPIMKINFGQSAFTFTVNATPLLLIHQHQSTKGCT